MPSIRCIGSDGSQIGVISTRDAMAMAEREGFDLVEIAPHAQPPVCRIMDYGKYKYDLDKKERQAKQHHVATKVKEVQFHPNVGDHDYQTKLRHLHEFLEEGHRVKVGLFFRGREHAHKELGFELMNRVIKDCEGVGVAEQAPKFLGRNIFMLLTPKPGAKPRQKQQDSQPSEPSPAGG